ncbi:hypothetical protein LSM04_002889 [Trypanosoma melophagium]|uniref:uncharacterized protein n=1 Tax=Trypanosoma melophagium TaxID=715481 RepID=UPI00351A2076|nr:hypothetical protein LSM04_002889 [Trypanosoma melophagium]
MLYHGSHPEHPMQMLRQPSAGVMCSICKACAHPSMVEWGSCTQKGCNYFLCLKCMEIDEQLFDTPQVIIRNPVLSHEDTGVCLRTRPRGNAHILCPLYPGRLMVAVSSAKGSIDPNETYYRLKSGGWVNAAHVVRVIPSQQLIEELARTHLRTADRRSEGFMPLEDVFVCIEESFRLMDERSPYGPIMASLTFLPLIQYSSSIHLISPEERVAFVRASLGFVHYLFHFVLDEVKHWLNNVDHRVKSTVLTLYVELLRNSLAVTRDVAASQVFSLPSELGPLVTQTAKAAVALMPIVECGTPLQGDPDEIMQTRSVVTRQVDIAEEQAWLFTCCRNMVEIAGWLLLHTSSFTYDFNDIHHFRVAISIIPKSETLKRMLCQVATNAMERIPSLQNKIHDLDVLEVAISLASKSTCAESQIAVFKLIGAIVHKSPRNIMQISSLVITPLFQLAKKALNTVVANAAFDCFVELSYNDPRVDSSRLDSESEALVFPVCTAVIHPNVAPYQMMSVYELDMHRMALCEHCRITHPPENAVPVREPQFAYFRCQCACCIHEKVTNPLPPANIPSTPAIQEMINCGISQLMLHWLHRSESAVANNVGRLSLKVAVSMEVILALYRALLKQTLIGYSDAAFAIAAHSHHHAIREMHREHPYAAISQYLSSQPGFLRSTVAAEGTPGKDSYYDDTDGLSPSPDVAGKKSDVYALLPSGVSPPLVDLFTGPQKMYLNDVL